MRNFKNAIAEETQYDKVTDIIELWKQMEIEERILIFNGLLDAMI